MAGPSSTRDRGTSGVHHHHRTISSTTLLLVLSLVLAVLAVMLSIPNRSGSANLLNPEAPGSGLWGYLTPRRSQVLVARESQVALREAEVARREAELLAGQPGGLTIASCEPCPACTPVAPPPLQTIIQEFTREVEPLSSPAPPAIPAWWKEVEERLELIFERELKVSDREKDVGRREEQVNRREHDAGRRETWIMEQLLNLNNQPQEIEEEEVIYETRRPKPKELPPSSAAPPPMPPPVTEYVHQTVQHQTVQQPVRQPPQQPLQQPLQQPIYHQPSQQSAPPSPMSAPMKTVRTRTITRTLLPETPVGTPAQTRVAAPPTPEDFSSTADTPPIGRTRNPQQVVEVVEEEVADETPTQPMPERETETIYVRERPKNPPRGWW